jgi:hypothetical protein
LRTAVPINTLGQEWACLVVAAIRRLVAEKQSFLGSPRKVAFRRVGHKLSPGRPEIPDPEVFHSEPRLRRQTARCSSEDIDFISIQRNNKSVQLFAGTGYAKLSMMA